MTAKVVQAERNTKKVLLFFISEAQLPSIFIKGSASREKYKKSSLFFISEAPPVSGNYSAHFITAKI
jgi:hypothetical protein